MLFYIYSSLFGQLIYMPSSDTNRYVSEKSGIYYPKYNIRIQDTVNGNEYISSLFYQDNEIFKTKKGSYFPIYEIYNDSIVVITIQYNCSSRKGISDLMFMERDVTYLISLNTGAIYQTNLNCVQIAQSESYYVFQLDINDRSLPFYYVKELDFNNERVILENKQGKCLVYKLYKLSSRYIE